ncbi:MAG: AAA family ATPase [Gammaproteobacteria bacterium]|nr:AAA family ATPase [Gammaproteobacteria bacterium]MBU1415193.1 AAA family ATPase [Gammaproteobacteria bacterium]
MKTVGITLARRGKLERLTTALEHGLIERRNQIRLALLAALAGEHTLLVGPPGTAKSELARRLHLAFRDARYFERLLTRFSVPEELFGPLSIAALEQDRYERQTAGFLPEAGIAFIDEVFKANSAILNALLTLLNERRFDNGAGRQACPLISVIGATNEVPEDEIAEAFFDRFLLRLPVAPVSGAGFGRLLELDDLPALPGFAPLDGDDLAGIAAAVHEVTLAPGAAGLLAELRTRQEEGGVYVSDRRWVKIVRLLKVAAATEDRREVCLWDLWLLPWCAAPDAEGQQALADWLAGRLGVRAACSPPRLTRVVEAFEAQARLEHEAEDLDYDDEGRLKFGAEVNARVVDAKGAAEVPRLSFHKQRRYGATHIGARLRQIDDLAARLDGYRQELADYRAGLADYRERSLWLDQAFADRAAANLVATTETLAQLRARLLDARAQFQALPRLPVDPGIEPEPVAHETLG